jgi:hypothetical protein
MFGIIFIREIQNYFQGGSGGYHIKNLCQHFFSLDLLILRIRKTKGAYHIKNLLQALNKLFYRLDKVSQYDKQGSSTMCIRIMNTYNV